MNIRMGNAGDLAAIMPMMRKHRALHEQWDAALYALRPDADVRYRRWLGPIVEDPRTFLLVAEEHGQIVGFLTAVVEKDMPIYHCEEYAAINDLWVEPAWRRHGVAIALVEQAAREYTAVGIRQLRIQTAVANTAARAMLERAGFRPGTIDLLRQLPEATGDDQ
jgi:ribosomal protein S18 acetylase RimI-like enzyme